MKKIFLSLVLFFIFPVFVNAAEYKITDQLIQAEIQNDGDLLIKELIVMDGSFNGYEKSLSYANNLLEDDNYANNKLYNAKGINLIDISGKYVDKVTFDTMNDSDFEHFEKTSLAFNGDKAKYTREVDNNGYTYRLYYKSNNNRVAFLITYEVDSVVVMHEDVAELYWNFVTSNDYDDLKNVQVKVILPGEDKGEDFRLWLHGSLSGEIKKINNQSVLAKYDEMDKSDVLDIRLTFDKSLITDRSKVKMHNEKALDKIIEVEEKRAEIANNLRAELKGKYNFIKYATISFYIGIVLLVIFIYLKYGKSPKSNYYSKYNREFIEDYNVEVIDYLMKKRITPNALTASIMNLIYKKNISAKDISKDGTKNKDYEFTLENTDNINDSEEILIEFLFDKVGADNLNEENKKYFTTKDLKKYSNGTKTCDKFIASYTKWKNDIIKKGKQENFYESFGAPKLIGIVALIVGMLIFMLSISFETDFFPTYIIPIIAIIFLVFTLLLDRKTQKGIDHYTKWNAFKNFLNDFGSFELKELPEIVLWERYLVYATIFGLANKVQKAMNVHIKELELSDTYVDYYPSFFYINLGSTINQSVNNAINNAYSRQAANYANSHSSSSSGGGFGGGASFGGGFGGGGSSGHGF